jgi:hypothetical protein
MVTEGIGPRNEARAGRPLTGRARTAPCRPAVISMDSMTTPQSTPLQTLQPVADEKNLLIASADDSADSCCGGGCCSV